MTGVSPLVYLVAGEASGDLLGAKLMRALKEKTGGGIRFAGIGGPLMEAEGLAPLFPMRELSLMGIVEIVPHIPRLFKLWRMAADDIRAKMPDMVITIDAPGFAQRLMKLVRRECHPRPILVHYVAPTVWAYRAGRARHLAKLYDNLLVLLPFEPPYFEKEGLPTSFVGHPVVENFENAVSNGNFRGRHRIDELSSVITMLPGSRRGEVKRHLPVFRDVCMRLDARKNITIVMPVPMHLMGLVTEMTSGWPLRLIIVPSGERQQAFTASDLALAKSGTVTLELALAKVAMVTMYKISALSAFALRRMLKISRYNLINILLKRDVIPELMQEDASAEKLTHALTFLLDDPAAQKLQIEASQEALAMLGMGDAARPSERAANTILKMLRSKGLRDECGMADQPEPR